MIEGVDSVPPKSEKLMLLICKSQCDQLTMITFTWKLVILLFTLF